MTTDVKSNTEPIRIWRSWTGSRNKQQQKADASTLNYAKETLEIYVGD